MLVPRGTAIRTRGAEASMMLANRCGNSLALIVHVYTVYIQRSIIIVSRKEKLTSIMPPFVCMHDVYLVSPSVAPQFSVVANLQFCYKLQE